MDVGAVPPVPSPTPSQHDGARSPPRPGKNRGAADATQVVLKQRWNIAVGKFAKKIIGDHEVHQKIARCRARVARADDVYDGKGKDGVFMQNQTDPNQLLVKSKRENASTKQQGAVVLVVRKL